MTYSEVIKFNFIRFYHKFITDKGHDEKEYKKVLCKACKIDKSTFSRIMNKALPESPSKRVIYNLKQELGDDLDLNKLFAASIDVTPIDITKNDKILD